MSVDKNIIKKAVTGIEFTEESKQRIFEGFERKKTLKKIFYMKIFNRNFSPKNL